MLHDRHADFNHNLFDRCRAIVVGRYDYFGGYPHAGADQDRGEGFIGRCAVPDSHCGAAALGARTWVETAALNLLDVVGPDFTTYHQLY